MSCSLLSTNVSLAEKLQRYVQRLARQSLDVKGMQMDRQTAFQLYIYTSKCTCPVVQGVGCKWMLCMIVPYKPAMCSLSVLWTYLYTYSLLPNYIAIYIVPPYCQLTPMENYMRIPVVSYAYLYIYARDSLMISFAYSHASLLSYT